MSRIPPSSRQRITLFGSSWLERLTVVSVGGFMVLWALLLPVIALVAMTTAPTLWAPVLFVFGWLVWSLTEYALHRHVFHLEPQSPLLQRIVFIIHGNHHADSNDPLRNLMPPAVSVPVGALIWAASVATMGAAGSWFLLGFMVGYVTYDLVHYACHQYPMKGKLGRALKTHHMRHHHRRAHGNYAITGMIWDRIFSTRISLREDA